GGGRAAPLPGRRDPRRRPVPRRFPRRARQRPRRAAARRVALPAARARRRRRADRGVRPHPRARRHRLASDPRPSRADPLARRRAGPDRPPGRARRGDPGDGDEPDRRVRAPAAGGRPPAARSRPGPFRRERLPRHREAPARARARPPPGRRSLRRGDRRPPARRKSARRDRRPDPARAFAGRPARFRAAAGTPMSSRARSGAPLALAVWTVLAALTSLAPAPLSAAVEPFYLGLYADGAQAYERGEFLAAARQLRLACFGMLDDPPLLGCCLARLAVAQAQSGDGDGFRESFRRLAEAEDQFQGYTKAELPAAVRAAFERLAATRIPAELLGASPSFSRLKIQSEAARIEALPLKARREELARKLAAEPKNPAWKVLLGRLEIADGHPAAALAQAQAALALAAEDGSAHCLRGLAQARLGACAQGLADLETCAETNQFATPAAARLGCLVEVQAWDRARAFVASLTPALREDRDLARLAHRIKSDRETAKPADLPAPSVPTATAAAPPST